MKYVSCEFDCLRVYICIVDIYVCIVDTQLCKLRNMSRLYPILPNNELNINHAAASKYTWYVSINHQPEQRHRTDTQEEQL